MALAERQPLENPSENHQNFKIIPGRKNFTQISNMARKDIVKNAGHIAFAIFEYMISKPLDWHFYPRDIAKECCINRNTAYKYLNRLIDLGYVARQQLRSKETGQYGTTIYKISQTPIFLKENLTQEPHTDSPYPINSNTATILEKNKDITNNIYSYATNNKLLFSQSMPELAAAENENENLNLKEKRVDGGINVADQINDPVTSSPSDPPPVDVVKIRAVLNSIPVEVRDAMSGADRKQVVAKLKTFHARYDVERLKAIVLYALDRGKGMGYLHTCLEKGWPEKKENPKKITYYSGEDEEETRKNTESLRLEAKKSSGKNGSQSQEEIEELEKRAIERNLSGPKADKWREFYKRKGLI